MKAISLITRGYIDQPFQGAVPLDVVSTEITIEPEIEINVDVESDVNVSVTVCKDD